MVVGEWCVGGAKIDLLGFCFLLSFRESLGYKGGDFFNPLNFMTESSNRTALDEVNEMPTSGEAIPTGLASIPDAELPLVRKLVANEPVQPDEINRVQAEPWFRQLAILVDHQRGQTPIATLIRETVAKALSLREQRNAGLGDASSQGVPTSGPQNFSSILHSARSHVPVTPEKLAVIEQAINSVFDQGNVVRRLDGTVTFQQVRTFLRLQMAHPAEERTPHVLAADFVENILSLNTDEVAEQLGAILSEEPFDAGKFLRFLSRPVPKK